MPTAKTKKKLDLQFVLETIDIPAFRKAGTNRHILTVDLIWPRVGIARRTCTLQVPLVNGLCATDAWSLANKLCFKESCEQEFAINVSLTETLTEDKVNKFMRYMAGQSAAVASDAVEDALAIPVVDELAALPLLYLSKRLLASQDPNLIATGAADLNAGDFAQGVHKITVPLVAKQAIETADGSIDRLDDAGAAIFIVKSL